jgi:hypothetical protein
MAMTAAIGNQHPIQLIKNVITITTIDASCINAATLLNIFIKIDIKKHDRLPAC